MTLEYKDLKGMMKPEIHVDEFESKMGEDEDVIVISFFVRDQQASKDLMNWFETGYDFIIDADRSPGEIKPNRYLVYVEIRRRSNAAAKVQELLNDLNTLTEFEPDDWVMRYNKETVPWSEATFERLVPLSPRDYREREEKKLNEMRMAAGLPVRRISRPSRDLVSLQNAAGIRIY